MEDRNSYVKSNIKKLLKKNGMKYADLARMSGLSEDTIKKIFRKHYDEEGNIVEYFPSVKTLEAVAKVFNTTYDCLIVPDIDTLMQDVCIAKDLMKDDMFYARKRKQNAQSSFHSAMLEKGFQQTAATVDYLQFMGYEVRFIANDSKYDKRIKEEADNIVKLKKKYQKQIDSYNHKKDTVYSQLIESRTTEVATEKEQEEKEKREIVLNDEYQACLFEVIQLQQNMDALKNNKKFISRKIGLEQAIEMLNLLDINNPFQREHIFGRMNVSVAVNEFGSFEEPAIMPLKEFYGICKDIKDMVKGKILKKED